MLTWPAALPQRFLVQGFRYDLPDNTVRFDGETGPSKTRRRSTAAIQSMNGDIECDTDEMREIARFYRNTSDGADAFMFPDQFSPVGYVLVRFAGAPSISAVTPDRFRVSLAIELLP